MFCSTFFFDKKVDKKSRLQKNARPTVHPGGHFSEAVGADQVRVDVNAIFKLIWYSKP